MIDGKLAYNLSLRLKLTKILLSDLLDTSVLFIQNNSEAESLVSIRNRLNSGITISTNVAEKVRTIHSAYFAQSYAFSQASYDDVLAGSLGIFKLYALEALARWGQNVPGTTYCWLVDIHARALRTHNKSVAKNVPERQWARALDWRSPFPAFGQGSRITYREYLKLTADYRRLRAFGYPSVQPIPPPDGWNIYRSKNENEYDKTNIN